ncbi:MAG: CDP-diacylglycerol--serine O-phosphatidyltransferase [Spirochaetes bacterium]|nr:CDP-diacylglycerol--serine O-phosphatidyltransferase [Spirochaetota bacterium]
MTRRKKIGEFIKKKRSIVPNMITMSNMTMGFFAILFASKGDAVSITVAGVLVFFGAICDALDGAVARAMNVASPVGVELDSLADGIAYGIAPAVIAYQAFLIRLPQLGHGFDVGMIIAPIYPICAIYRLARFNISSEEKYGFTGLPSPAAGIVIACIPGLSYATFPFFGSIDFTIPLEVFIVIYIFIGLLMVSKVDYNKIFADIYKKSPVILVITVLALGVLLFFFRMWAIFTVTALYIIAGLVNYMVKSVRRIAEMQHSREGE